jgi:flagellar hook-basal body complex protein FliE
MVALGKSEVAFKLISSLSQKVIGGFEKLVSMQV